jgi:hypothetical protein
MEVELHSLDSDTKEEFENRLRKYRKELETHKKSFPKSSSSNKFEPVMGGDLEDQVFHFLHIISKENEQWKIETSGPEPTA